MAEPAAKRPRPASLDGPLGTRNVIRIGMIGEDLDRRTILAFILLPVSATSYLSGWAKGHQRCGMQHQYLWTQRRTG